MKTKTTGLLDELSSSLRPRARFVGETTARMMFKGRGNAHDISLNEYELAAVIATGCETALALAELAVES